MSSGWKNKSAAQLARDSAVFAMYGAMMFVSKIVMESLPNIHLLALFIGALTLVYRRRALIPLYLYVLLDGLVHGFSLWWVPYLYIYLPLFFAFLLLPRDLSRRAGAVLCPLICGCHGLLYGTLYAPAQALFFGLDFSGTLAWIAAGLPFDLIHAASNAVLGTLVLPFAALIRKLERAH